MLRSFLKITYYPNNREPNDFESPYILNDVLVISLLDWDSFMCFFSHENVCWILQRVAPLLTQDEGKTTYSFVEHFVFYLTHLRFLADVSRQSEHPLLSTNDKKSCS